MALSPLINDDKRHTEEKHAEGKKTSKWFPITIGHIKFQYRTYPVKVWGQNSQRSTVNLSPSKNAQLCVGVSFCFRGILSCSPTHLFIFHACKSSLFDYEIANDVTLWFLVVQKYVVQSWWHGDMGFHFCFVSFTLSKTEQSVNPVN